MFQDILQQWLAWSAVTLLVRQAVLCQAPLASLRPLCLCCALSRCGQQRWASGTPSKKQTIFQCTKSSFVALRAHSECNKKILLRISQTEIASIFFCCFLLKRLFFSLLTSLRQEMFFSPFMFFDALLAGVKFAKCFLLKFCWNDCFFPFGHVAYGFVSNPAPNLIRKLKVGPLVFLQIADNFKLQSFGPQHSSTDTASLLRSYSSGKKTARIHEAARTTAGTNAESFQQK